MEIVLSYTVFLVVSAIGTLLSKRCFSDADSVPNKKTYILICTFSLIISSIYVYLVSAREQGIQFADCMRLFVVMSFLPYIGFIDFKLLIIPNKMLLCLLIFRILLISQDYINYKSEISNVLLAGLISAVTGGIVFFIPRLFSKEGMGMGDIKLIMTVGLFYDLSRLFVFMFTSLVLSSLAGIFLMIFFKKNRKTALPFAPFFMVGAYFCAFLSVM